ncbi:MAG: peptide chain release factor N(5)-glutamine methyltransferase [Lagierella massiliensis]|nr:peptide chain release factor N(5)-glutamine methyltransferase [Lagierella massiliensis]
MVIKDILDLFGKADGFFVIENILQMDRTYALLNQGLDIEEEKEIAIRNIYNSYKQNFPINYILEKKNFYGRDFIVKEGVLIPRFETEILIEKLLSMKIEFSQILDIGCGSGIISLTLALEISNSKVIGVDISDKALEVSLLNKNLLGVKNCNFYKSDLYSNLMGKKFDLIVSNPPYITKDDMNKLDSKVKKEPKLALYGGEDGLDFYKAIILNSHSHLNEKGYIAFEIGYDQGETVPQLLYNSGYEDIKVIKDYNGFDRCVIARSIK